MARIGFLYNHYAPHQVLHTAPVAFALSSMSEDVDVELIASCDAELSLARRIGRAWPAHSVRFTRADQPPLSTLRRRVRIPGGRPGKKRVLRANLRRFAELDALVLPERTSTALRSQPGIEHLQLILVPHGAGDGAIGYEARNAEFDLILAPGEKCRRRFVDQAGVAPERVRVIGYPKFDATAAEPRERLFPQDRPTVLYNPHFKPKLSSWPPWGRRVLDWFAGQSAFNLIFAPHVMLYRRPWRHRARSLRRYRGLDHLLVDTGSTRCIDMTYTASADIYLGDVSSQIYEFLRRPRPAVFLNANGVAGWQRDPSYRHWRLGRVVDELEALPDALHAPLSRELEARQRAAMRETFDEGHVSAPERAARAILAQVGAQPTCPPSVASA